MHILSLTVITSAIVVFLILINNTGTILFPTHYSVLCSQTTVWSTISTVQYYSSNINIYRYRYTKH